MNKVILTGRLGAGVELNGNGKKVAKFSLATSEKWAGKDGEKQEKTEWHRVVVFGKRGENCANYLDKGSLVSVEGKITYSQYEKDGQTLYSTDIIAQNVEFLDSKKEDNPKQNKE